MFVCYWPTNWPKYVLFVRNWRGKMLVISFHRRLFIFLDLLQCQTDECFSRSEYHWNLQFVVSNSDSRNNYMIKSSLKKQVKWRQRHHITTSMENSQIREWLTEYRIIYTIFSYFLHTQRSMEIQCQRKLPKFTSNDWQ